MKRSVIAQKWPDGIPDKLTLPCANCGTVPYFDFTVDDAIWKAVVSEEHRLGVLCLLCFDKLASEQGIDVTRHLQQVFYLGHGKTVKFGLVEAWYWPPKSPVA